MTSTDELIPNRGIYQRFRVGESQWKLTTYRFLRNPQGRVALLGLGVLAFLAIFAGALSVDPNAQDASARFLPPSWEHFFGVDQLRRDMFSRTIHGLRISLLISFVSVTVGSAIGIITGLITSYVGGWVESLAMRFVDALLAFPGLLAALAIITILGPSIRNVGVAIAFFSIPSFTRLARGQMLSEKRNEYVIAAQTIGAGPFRVIFGHIALNAIPPLLTQVALFMSTAVLLEASLSFLGMGQQPPDPSLGGLISASKTFLRQAWWYPLFPGATLALLLVSLNLFADASNEATSPWARR
jgi:peptide/nickel transport system permease protein